MEVGAENSGNIRPVNRKDFLFAFASVWRAGWVVEVLVDGLFPFGEAEPAEGVVAATYSCISISPNFEF